MNDIFTKFILLGILLCLVIIAFKPKDNQFISPTPNVNVSTSTGQQIIQLAPNRIAVKGTTNSDFGETILIFDYDSSSKKFTFVTSMNYADYFRNPSKYGVPTSMSTN